MGYCLSSTDKTKELRSLSYIEQQNLTYSDQVVFGSQKLYEVQPHEMKQKLHKHIVALIWRDNYRIGRGSGLLISPNLVLTSAHNLYLNRQNVDHKLIQIYPGQIGELKIPYRVEKVYSPTQFRLAAPQVSTLYDYALVKLTERVKTQDFICLKEVFDRNDVQLAIFGYPDSRYQSVDKTSSGETVSQWGRIKKNPIVSIKLSTFQMRYCLSTLPGQSGSPIIQRQGQKLFVVGIHKGGLKFQLNGQKIQANVGRMLNKQVLKQLKQEAKKMGAEVFRDSNQVLFDEIKLQVAQIPFNQNNHNAEQKPVIILKESKGNKQTITFKQVENQINTQTTEKAQQKPKIDFKLPKVYANNQHPSPTKKLVFNLNFSPSKQQANKQKELSKEWNEKGDQHYYKNDIPSAINCYKKAIEINPQYSVAYNNLGLMMQNNKQNEEAIQYYKAAIASNSENILALTNLASSLVKANRLQESIIYFLKIIEINPLQLQTYMDLGSVHSKTNNLQQASKCYLKVVQINPKYEQAYYKLGRVFRKTGKLEFSLEMFKKVIGINPRNAEAYYNIGCVLLQDNKDEQASKYFQKCVQLNPGHSQAMKKFLSIFYKNNS